MVFHGFQMVFNDGFECVFAVFVWSTIHLRPLFAILGTAFEKTKNILKI